MEFGNELAEEFEENAKSIINGDVVTPHQLQTVKIRRKKRFGLF